ncbi:MAG: transcriptional regulator [Pseudonocardiaceae bacterium]
MTDHSGTTAGELVAQTQRELVDTADAIRSHRFLERLRARDVPDERLRALAGEQHAIVSSDRRSFAQLAARFPAGLAGGFFLGMAEGEGLALDKLRGLADWLGLTDDDLRAHEPHPGAQAYPSFVAWLALNGSRAEVVLAFLANLAAWGENCGQVAAALRESYGAGDDAVAFFDFFANPPEGFEAHALAVLNEGLAAGDSPLLARRATRLLQAYELSFWDALAEGL